MVNCKRVAAVDGVAAPASPSKRFTLFAIGLLYISFGTSFGLLQGGLPPILRVRGMDVQAMGWMFVLYVPLGLTFLWAPLVDRFALLPRLGFRTSWVVGMQGLTVVVLCAIAVGETFPSLVLFALGLIIAFAAATMDLALDAYAVEILSERQRPAAAMLKVGFLGLGGVIGGGVLVGLFQSVGWQTIFLLVAALTLACTLPILFFSGTEPKRTTQTRSPASLIRALRTPAMLRRLVLLAGLTTALIAIVYFDRIVLVDMGVNLESIGWVFGTLSPLANAAAALGFTMLGRSIGPKAALWSLTILCLTGTVIIVTGMPTGWHGVVMAAMVLQSAAAAGLSVAVYTLMLRWSAGDQAATDYALLCGGSRLVATLVLIAIPGSVSRIGWAGFYAICGLVLLGLVFILQRGPNTVLPVPRPSP